MAVISSSLRGDTGGDAQTIEQTPPVGEAETADWKLTRDLLRGLGGTHMPRVLSHCVIAHVGSPRWRDLYFIRWRAGLEASISGVEKTFAEEALKISSLKTTQDIKREVSHLDMIGCPLTCWVYRQHQRSRHSERSTAAIELAPGQYVVIGPIWEVQDLFWTTDWWS